VRAARPRRAPRPGPPAGLGHAVLEQLPLLAVGAIVLSTGVEVLPAGGIVWKLTLGRLLVIAALGALIATGARTRDFRTGLDAPIALLVLAAIVTTLRHPLAGVDEAAPLRFLLTVVVFYYVTVALVRRLPGSRLALPMIATFAIVASAVVGVAQVAQGTPTGFYRDGLTPVVSQVPRNDLLPRADGSFANPNLLATHVLLLAPLAVAFALTAVAREVKVSLFALAALAYLGLILTFSRAGVGAALLAGAVVAYATRPAWRLRIRQGAIVAVVLILLGIVVTGGDLVGGFGRPEAWKLSVQVWKDNPLTGVGLGRAGDALNAKGGAAISYRHAHNLWLTWLVEAGPVAFAAWIWITAWLLWRGWRAALKKRTLAAASLAGVVGFFAFSMLDHPSNTERIATAFWFIAALIAAGVRPPEGPWRVRRPAFLGVLALLPVLLFAGCGADDEPSTDASSPSTAGSASAPTTAQTVPPPTEGLTTVPTDATPTKPPTTRDTNETPPPGETQPGGGGDEEPVGIDADFSGRNGKLSPSTVQVPPFIAISVTVTSKDGATYSVDFGKAGQVTATPGKPGKLKLDGLHQNGTYTGTVAGGGTVKIEANAEPGP
jgi:O-antigen ligase